MKYSVFSLALVLLISACVSGNQESTTATTAAAAQGTAALPTTATTKPTATPQAAIFVSLKNLTVGSYQKELREIEWSPDNKFLYATVGGDVVIFDAESGIELKRATSDYRKLAASPDGRFLVSGQKIYDAKNLNIIKDFKTAGDSNNLGSGVAAFSPDSSKLATIATTDVHYIRIFETSTWQKISEFSGVQDKNFIYWSNDGKKLNTGAAIIDSSAGTKLKDSLGVYSPDEKKAGKEEFDNIGTITIFNVYDAETSAKLSRFNMAAINVWQWSPDSKFILTTAGELFDTSGKKIGKASPGAYMDLVKWSPNGKKVVFADENYIRIFSVNL